MRRCLLFALSVAAGTVAAADDDFVATATSDPVPVETVSGGARTARGIADVAYAPRYSYADIPEGAGVVLKKVERPDTSYAVTSVVETCASGADGNFRMELTQGEGRYVRLLHELRSADGELLGETLAGDVVFAYTGKCSTAVFVDTRPDSFQLAAEKGGSLPLAYDSAWCTNGVPAAVEIGRVQNRYSGGELRTSRTNGLFSASAPCLGSVDHRFSSRDGGTFVFECVFRDAEGNELGDPLQAVCRFRELWGFSLLLK